MRISFAVTASAVTAVCLLGTGCSSSGSGKPSGTGVGPSIKAAAAAGAPSANAGGSGGVSCKQLTFGEVQPLITDKVISVTTTALNLGGSGQQCQFNAKGTDSTGSITVQVLRGSGGPKSYAQEVAGEDKPVAVTGVGEKASRDTESGSVNALEGDEFCSVSYSSSDEIPGVGPLEEAHGATINIGENYYDTIALAMGTLCNRLYGSGSTTADLSTLLAADATATPSDGGGLPTTISLPTDGPTG
jgi:hypothetical protein